MLWANDSWVWFLLDLFGMIQMDRRVVALYAKQLHATLLFIRK